jgi:hypothetical protein
MKRPEQDLSDCLLNDSRLIRVDLRKLYTRLEVEGLS